MIRTVESGELFFKRISSYLELHDLQRVNDAYDMAREAHGDQRRRSGELFFTHPLTVAYYLAEYQLDAPALIAALLHDVAEDTRVSIEEIGAAFGLEVALLVDGVTKLKDVSKGMANGRQPTKKEQEDATLAKLLGVMVDDIRAVIIKLFDRLHNMRTIDSMPKDRQKHKANETLSFYAPLADRLGIWRVKNELEAISLQVLYPETFTRIRRNCKRVQKEMKPLFAEVSAEIRDCLGLSDVEIHKITLDPSNIYSTYQDQKRAGVSAEHVDKNLRIAIQFKEEWLDCYKALGFLHQRWKPVSSKFDDYIAFPRQNLYRSLHTTVVHSNGRYIKLRLRTVDMSKVSEVGVLAKWLYKGTELSESIEDRIKDFLGNIKDNLSLDPHNPTAGVQGIVEDVLVGQMHVYTPKGESVQLSQKATAVDFAYAIHTGLGHQCQNAVVNGNLYALNKPLTDGDQVQIIKRPIIQPQRAWLDEDLGYIATNYARNQARRWFRRLSPDDAIMQGKPLLQAELEMLGMADYAHEQVASLFDYSNSVPLYHDIGRAELLPTAVATSVLEANWSEKLARSHDNAAFWYEDEEIFVTKAGGRALRLCGSCQPRPPYEIYGYIRKDGGVTVHRKDCHTLQPDRTAGRMIELGWGAVEQHQTRAFTVRIKVYDRPGLMHEVASLTREEDVNISYINTPEAPKGQVHLVIGIEVERPRQLVRILHRIQALLNVFEVHIIDSHYAHSSRSPTSLYTPE